MILFFKKNKIQNQGNSLVVLWLGLCTTVENKASIPGWGTKIPQGAQHGKKKKKSGKNKLQSTPVSVGPSSADLTNRGWIVFTF